MASITRCCKKPPEAGYGLVQVAWGRLVAALMIWLAVCAPVVAQNTTPVQNLRLERMDDGYYLGAQLQFDLPPNAEDALNKGVALYFLLRCDVSKERWYWSNKRVAQTERYIRLSYQPLSRRWRMNVSSAPISQSGLGMVYGQSFDTQAEALAAMQRISRWRVAEVNQIEIDGKFQVELSLRLDLSQLPRPLQMGALGESDWSLNISHQQSWVPEPLR